MPKFIENILLLVSEWKKSFKYEVNYLSILEVANLRLAS